MNHIELSHFAQKFEFDPSRSYEEPGKVIFKPNGLWLSNEANYGWSEWCRGESFGVHKLKIETKFKLNVDSCIHISNATELKKFNDQFQNGDLLTPLPDGMSLSIDWLSVKKQYGGILLSPYLHHCRFEYIWYSCWDCASACVWDLSLVELVK